MNFARQFFKTILALLVLLLVACGDDSPSNTNEGTNTSTDILSGKVWFVIGDSYSHGDWAGIEPTPRIQEGKYRGKLPSYSYLIGNRTGMDIHNIAVIGSTLAMYGESKAEYTFTHPKGLLYTVDFSKADYITIYYGINDSYLNIPIGTVEDSIPDTFLGAFNTAISYLTQHYPKAKIGLIVSNGCYSRDYPDATVKAAEKWGLPYLDLDGGINCATMLLCSSRNPASEEERQAVLEQQRISPANNHPNEFAHQLESIYIEKWLRSL